MNIAHMHICSAYHQLRLEQGGDVSEAVLLIACARHAGSAQSAPAGRVQLGQPGVCVRVSVCECVRACVHAGVCVCM